jgi:hypothetical protein
VFETWAITPGKGPGPGKRRRSRPRPTIFYTDRRRFPLAEATTTDLGKALIWHTRAGPYNFLSRHPQLKARFHPVEVEAPAAVAAQKIADRRREKMESLFP